MFKNFEEFLSNNKVDESNDNRVIIKYRWLDYFKNQWYETKCEVISHTDKSAQIKLLEFGPRGSRPGRVMRVHLKSLVGFNDGKQKSEPDTSWRRYTDPDLYKDDDEVNESKTVIERESEAKNLVEQTKKYFEDGDMENAAKGWCKIYDLYDDMYNEDTHTEQEKMQLFTDFQNVMTLFTDDEVFGITDYLKKHFNR